MSDVWLQVIQQGGLAVACVLSCVANVSMWKRMQHAETAHAKELRACQEERLTELRSALAATAGQRELTEAVEALLLTVRANKRGR